MVSKPITARMVAHPRSRTAGAVPCGRAPTWARSSRRSSAGFD